MERRKSLAGSLVMSVESEADVEADDIQFMLADGQSLYNCIVELLI